MGRRHLSTRPYDRRHRSIYKIQILPSANGILVRIKKSVCFVVEKYGTILETSNDDFVESAASVNTTKHWHNLDIVNVTPPVTDVVYRYVRTTYVDQNRKVMDGAIRTVTGSNNPIQNYWQICTDTITRVERCLSIPEGRTVQKY